MLLDRVLERASAITASPRRLVNIARRPEALRWYGVVGFFFLAAIIQTWPLLLHATDSISNWPQRPEDAWSNLWNLWWVKHALIDLQTNPFHTDHILYPQGADLYLHTLGILNGVLSIPFQIATGNVILSWNLLTLVLFVLSGVTTYALIYRITGNHVAGLVAGYVFTFSPYVLMRFGGHWNISTVWPLPLFVLALVKFGDTGRIRDALIVGGCGALIAFNNLEYAVDAALFLAIFVLYQSILRLRERNWIGLRDLYRGLPVVGAAGFIIGAPLLIPALLSILGDEVFLPRGAEVFSSDLQALVTPSPLWGPGEVPDITYFDRASHALAGDIENTVFLGFTPLILGAFAILAIRRLSQPVVFWLVVFLVFVSLAMGPHLYIGNVKEFSLAGVTFTVPMPYQLFDKLPLVSDRRGISRIITFGLLAFSVLAGLGADVLTSWVRRRVAASTVRLGLAATGVMLVSLIAVEYWNPPIGLQEQASPAIFREIGEEPGKFTVLHVPLGRTAATSATDPSGAQLANYYGRIHGKRTFGGYISRMPEDTLAWTVFQPGFGYLSCPNCTDFPKPSDLDAALVKREFDLYRVRYVAFHRQTPQGIPTEPPETMTALEAYLGTYLGLTPIHDEPAFIIFRNDDVAGAAAR